jgi:hypothetical protein
MNFSAEEFNIIKDILQKHVENKHKKKEYNKEYYEKKKETWKQKYIDNKNKLLIGEYENCNICNKNILKSTLNAHNATRRHLYLTIHPEFRGKSLNDNVECLCGGKFKYKSNTLHQKSKKHIEYLKSIV